MSASGPSTPTPRVGLGLPVYNGERYVAEAIDSILAQSFPDFELVISDNASTDGTEEICRGYAKRDARVRYLRNDVNRGVAFNFSRLFHDTTGPYFKWVVHDDVCEPDYLARCVEILDREPEDVVLAYPRTTLVDANGAFLERYVDAMDMRQERPSERLTHLLTHLRFCHCGLGLIRRSALAQTRLIDGFESSDVVMLAELALLGKFHEHPEFLYRRRVHPASSFGAYSGPQAYAERMDPARKGGKLPMPRTELFREMMRSIQRAPIPGAEKWRCQRTLLAHWGPRFWRVVGGEFRRRLRWELARATATISRKGKHVL